MFIWNLTRCDEGNTGKILARCRDVGLDHLVIKITDGTRQFNGDLLRPLFDALQEAGVAGWCWTYTYGRDPEREAEAFAVRAVALGVRGLVVDAEGDAYTGNPQAATRFMTTLRSIVGTMHTGFSSHRFPSNHKQFPFKAFMDQCESGWPQNYYAHQGAGVVRNTQRTIDEWKRYGKPLYVTGASYREGLGKPENIATMVRVCEANGIKMVNYWSWEHTAQGSWNVWNQIRAHKDTEG